MRTHPLATLLLAVPLTSCGAGEDDRVPPTVILVSLDTVRADELSRTSSGAVATPRLDAFAAKADRFLACVATAPWTLPTHASLFTGLYPFEHGAHSFLPEPGAEGARDNVFALHPRFETLAEALADRGYRTAGIVANAHYLRPTLGLEAGFATWDVSREPGAAVTRRALRWLDANHGDGRPAFLFVNYMDAHRPYRTGDPADRSGPRLDELIRSVMVRGEPPGELALGVRALHQAAVSELDGHVGALFDGLRERGLFEDALIVVTADHGEAFGAHGLVEHSKDVYEDLVRVPLLVKRPRQTVGRVRAERASSVDVPGLVAEALAGTDAGSIAATFPRVPGSHAVLAENHYSRERDLQLHGERFRRVRRAVYDGPLKLVVGSDGSIELYDLAEDPEELTDLAAERSADVERLVQRLEALLAVQPFEGERPLPGALDAARVSAMGELGYGPAGTEGDE